MALITSEERLLSAVSSKGHGSKSFQQREESTVAQMNSSEYLLSVPELSRYLGVSKSYIYKNVQREKLPHMRLGRLLKFNRAQIDEWLRRKEANSYSSGARIL